jgi:hypothetical protein
LKREVVMGFVIQSSDGTPLSQAAMRRLVEVIDGCRGQSEVWVVFKVDFPYQAVSVHLSEPPAEAAAQAGQGLSYFGPVAPEEAPKGFYGVKKVTGTTFYPLARPVATVVLLDGKKEEVARLSVTGAKGLPDVQEDVEALMFTPSSVDKYAIPYLTRVLGVEFAAQQRDRWLK